MGHHLSGILLSEKCKCTLGFILMQSSLTSRKLICYGTMKLHKDLTPVY